ncbi:MAG: CmcJ/NvfI family oxidoreductase [Proteobacteria bacterium]|nr:CmcJ/NvfI family oxidoreductase [Pseudomonadota bacterium]
MTESAALDTRAVQASVKYITDPGKDRLIYVPSEAGHDNSKWAGQYRDHVVDIHNARSVPPGFSLDREGFELVEHISTVTDFYDDAQISEIYEPEIEALLKLATGAARVHVFDHTRRADSRALREGKVVREPASIIHNDYTDASAAKRVRDLFPEDEAEGLLSRRFAIVNVWRSSNGAPIETAPLALCDATSLDDKDLITVERHSKDRIGEVLQVIENPRHRWFYFPQMQPDEVLLLKTYDSATDGRARFAVHTAFEDPTTPPGAAPRESIETRAFLFF